MSSGNNSNTNNRVRGYLGSHHRGYGGGGGHPGGGGVGHGRHQGNGPLSSPRGSFDNGGSVPSRSCVVGDNNYLFHYGRGGNVNGGQRLISAGPSGSGGNGMGLNQGIGILGNNVPHRSGKLNNYPLPTQKDREMPSIYGSGESSFDGVGGGDNILRSNSFGGGVNLAPLGGPAGGGKRKQHANPCRFAGHDHDWKDCPNNFRNKKRAKVMSGRGNIGMLDDAVAFGGSGGCAGMMIKEEWEPSTKRSSTMNNVVVRGVSMMVMHHGNNIHGPSERGGGGVGDGSAVLVTQLDHGGLIPGHYGPASSTSAADNISIGRMTERPNLVDRCGTTASGSFGGGVGSESRGYRSAKERGISCSIVGERGYDIVASERGYRSGLERMQRKSFAEDTVQSHDGAGTEEVGMRRNSPNPGMVGERQRSSHHQGHSRRVAVSLPGLLPTSQQMPSLIVSLKNERGYSLAAPSGASATQLLKRGLSTPGGFSVGRDCPAGRDEQKLFRDIPPPPPVLSTSLDLGWGDDSLSSLGGGTAPIPSCRPSPPPFCGNAKSLSVDIAATALSKDDSLYADLASPSPWYTLRVAASQGELGICDSHASHNKMANERTRHDCDDHAFCKPSFHGDSTQIEVLSPLSPSPLLRYSSSEAAATITNENNVDVKEKEVQLLPLTCASLGGADKVRKAEDIVAAMVKLADFNAFFSGDGVGVPLPSKIQITKAMSILENKIKFKSKEATCMRKDVIAIQAAEKEEEEHITISAKIEEEHITEEEALLTTDAEDRVRKFRLGREKKVSARQVILTNLSKSCCSVLQKKRETEVALMTETFQSDMDSKDCAISFQITLMYHQLHEVEKQMRIIISSPSSGLIPEELMSENDITHDGTGIPTYDFPGRMSELVGRIVTENRKVAKKAHLNVFECMPYFPIAGGTISSFDVSLAAKRYDAGDEAKTAALVFNKEWSYRARSVRNLYDALYSEPTKVPQYHNSNENFIKIALLVKECIRMKDAKLRSRWAMISEHYVLRQTMYHDETANASDCELGGYSFGAGFHHDRGSEYYDVMNNRESSTSSTPGLGGGNHSQSDSVVRGNNPYRSRPRRGISPGDVVRSDYEQEQIIAEIAAKEAMEKRIKEGGCPLPRQRGWLESVSTLMLRQFVFL